MTRYRQLSASVIALLTGCDAPMAEAPGNLATRPPTCSQFDGCAGAPLGSAQFPMLLNTYAVRPGWNVPGVDYYAGVPRDAKLVDASTFRGCGASYNSGTHQLTLGSGSIECDIDSLDFTAQTGVQLVNASHSGLVKITRSKFGCRSNNVLTGFVNFTGDAGSLDIEQSTMDGAGCAMKDLSGQGRPEFIFFQVSSGTVTLMWNFLGNAENDLLDLGIGNITPVLEYNVFYNYGTLAGSHPDTIQWCGTTSNNAVVAFNLDYEPINDSRDRGAWMIWVEAQNCGAVSVITNTAIDHNTVIARGGGRALAASFLLGTTADGTDGETVNGVTFSNNYGDRSGAYGFWGTEGRSPLGTGTVTNVTCSGNVDMETGRSMDSTCPGR